MCHNMDYFGSQRNIFSKLNKSDITMLTFQNELNFTFTSSLWELSYVVSVVINVLDCPIPIFSDVIKERSNNHHNRLETHTSPLMQPLLEEPNFRRLKRRLPIDLK
jgi:hypothetical protein